MWSVSALRFSHLGLILRAIRKDQMPTWSGTGVRSLRISHISFRDERRGRAAADDRRRLSGRGRALFITEEDHG